MIANEVGPLGGAILRVLEGALPLQHGPAGVVVLGELAEDGAKVYLAVPQGAKAPRPPEPGGIAPIDPLAPRGPEFGILHVKGAHPLVIEVEEGEVIELLQQHVAGVVEHVDPGVLAGRLEEALQRGAIEQVLPRVQLVADVHPGLVKGIEQGEPAPGQLGEGLLDEAGGPLGPGVEIGPGEGAGEGDVGLEAKPSGGEGGRLELIGRPLGASGRLAAHRRRGEAIEQGVIGGVDRQQLALQVGGELCDDQPPLGQQAAYLVAIILAGRRPGQIEQARVRRQLQAAKAEAGGPVRQAGEGIEWRLVPHELGEEDGRSLDGLHGHS